MSNIYPWSAGSVVPFVRSFAVIQVLRAAQTYLAVFCMPDFSHFHRFQLKTKEWYSQNVTTQLSMCKNDFKSLVHHLSDSCMDLHFR